MVLHFGNAYQPDDTTVVIEGPAFERKDNDPFAMLLMKNMKNSKDMARHDNGSKFKRYRVNLVT